jgi:hypothetical protein
MFSFISNKIKQAIESLTPSRKEVVKTFAKNFLDEIKDEIKEVEKKNFTKKKDPNAPKRAMNAYICFSTEKRPELREENPDLSPMEITQKIAELWRDMSEKEKESYKKMAHHDKERYESEISKYKSSDDESDSKPHKSKKKDANEPKRARSAYIIFCTLIRSDIKEKHPDLSSSDILKKTGEIWKNMTSDEKEKYNKLAEKDKHRYAKEKEEMSESSVDEEHKKDDDEEEPKKSKSKKDDDEEEKPKKSKSKKEDDEEEKPKKSKTKKDDDEEEKPKKRASAYINFCSQKRDEIKSENPDLSFGELSKKLGEIWKSMSEEDKNEYK